MPAVRAYQDASYIDPRLLSSSPDPHASFNPRPSTTSHTRSRSRSNSAASNHVTRPPNAFLLFRSEMIAQHKLKNIEHDQRNISRIVSHLWKDLPEQEKEHYRKAADIKKLQHQLENPDFKYQPGVIPETPKERRKRSGVEDEVVRARKVADTLKRGSPDYHQSSSSSHASHSRNEEPAYPSSSSRTAPSHHSPSTTNYPSTSYYPSASHHSSASHYPPSASSTSSHAYPSASHHSSSRAYLEQHYHQQGTPNEALTDAQLRHLMGYFNH